ncbi:hypothetical protein C9374_004290 [Naegleria lovaniensis]|uniref:TauD/TfdA-like domain-containing protein n=1 Tax=Naegleria lovaniensis TaxID=51637 RepID=A0AA88GR31_NAELO|nr:uncharacterized protein C9374_004290 [Naegleria lovaniensis]KAG2383619.1 hypothetical protein C9374_004290 [Naegleria lovaniensis]
MPSCLGSCLCSTFTSFFGNNDGKSRIQYRKLYGTLGSSTCPFSGKQQQQCGALPFGREILNVDISNGAKSLNDLEIIELRRALVEHHILLFRCSKPLSPTEQTQFCERLFGETSRYPYPVNNQEMLWNQELDTYIPGHPDIWKVVSTDYTVANQRVLSKCALISSCPSSPQPSTNNSSSSTQSIHSSPQKASYPQSPQQYNMPCQQLQQTPYSPSINMQSSSPQYHQYNYQQYGQNSPYNAQQYNYTSQQQPQYQQYNSYGNQSSLTPYYQPQQSPYSPLMKYETPRSFSPISSSSQPQQSTTTYNIDKPTFAAGNFFYWNCDGAYRHEICPTPVTVWNAALSNRDDEILFTDLQLAYERLDEAVKQKTSKVFSIIKGPNSSSVQPLVRKHPVTGKKGLYLHTGLLSGFLVSTDECNQSSTEQCPTEINNTINLPETKIKTMGCSCCKQLNQCLINHLDNGPVFRLKWKTGDIVVCDNMAVAFRGVHKPHIQQGQNTILYKTAIDTHDIFWLRDAELYKQC